MDRAHKEEKKSEVTLPRVDLTAMPNILEYLGYTLCPGTCVLGPWVTYEEYLKIFSKPVWVSVIKYVLNIIDCNMIKTAALSELAVDGQDFLLALLQHHLS